MQITDPIADLLTRVRNAQSAKHDTVEVPASNMKKAICQILVDEGYVQAKSMIPLSMLATLAGILYTFLGNIISTYKKNNLVFISTLAACLSNMAVLHALIGKLGVEAANIALLIGYLVSDAIRIKIIGREITYRINWKMFTYLLSFTGIVLLGYWKGQREDNIILGLLSFIVMVWILAGNLTKKEAIH